MIILKNLYKFRRSVTERLNFLLSSIDRYNCIYNEKEKENKNKIESEIYISTAHDQEEINSLKNAYRFALAHYLTFDFNIFNLNYIHILLNEHVTVRTELIGRFKDQNNYIVNKYSNESNIIVRCTVKAEYVYFEMIKLIDWLNERLNKKDMHPLIIAAVFCLRFTSIHPYVESNGRMSRILTTIILLKYEYNLFNNGCLENVTYLMNDEYVNSQILMQIENKMKYRTLVLYLETYLNIIKTGYIIELNK